MKDVAKLQARLASLRRELILLRLKVGNRDRRIEMLQKHIAELKRLPMLKRPAYEPAEFVVTGGGKPVLDKGDLEKVLRAEAAAPHWQRTPPTVK